MKTFAIILGLPGVFLVLLGGLWFEGLIGYIWRTRSLPEMVPTLTTFELLGGGAALCGASLIIWRRGRRN